jgi:hypothetical protein
MKKNYYMPIIISIFYSNYLFAETNFIRADYNNNSFALNHFSVAENYSFPLLSEAILPELGHANQQNNKWYDTSLQRKDLYITGDIVNIDSPLKSNGGDIVIICNKLNISAPIDSRPYFKRIGPFWYIIERSDPNARSGGPTFSYENTLHDIMGGAPKSFNSFKSVYQWVEFFNDETKTYQYRVENMPEVYSSVRDWRSWGLTAPQLPSAHVSAYYVADFSIANAPRINQSNSKSGNIYIYASEINLCDKCKVSLDPVKIINGDPFDYEEKVFFQASGVKGGRGGMGQPGMCFAPEGQEEKCQASYERGELSGLPSKAGDAGDIRIYLYGQDLSKQSFDYLIKVSKAKGGVPPQTHRIRTGNRIELRNTSDRVPPAFIPEAAILNINEFFGNNGTVTVEKITGAELLSKTSALLSSLELSRKYDLANLLSDPKLEAATWNLSPRTILHIFLMKELVLLQNKLLDQSVLLLKAKTSYDSDQNNNSFLKSLDCTVWHPGLNDIEFQDIRRICSFKHWKHDQLRSFLFRTGGILKQYRTSYEEELKHEEILRELITANESLHKAIIELKNINQEIYAAKVETQRKEMQANIDSLQASLNLIKESLEKQNDPLKIVEPIIAIGQVGSALGLIKAAYNVYLQSPDNDLEAPKKLLESFDKGYGSWQKLEEAISGLSKKYSVNDFYQINQKLSEARYDLLLFNREVSQTLDKMGAAKSLSLENALQAKYRYTRRVDKIRFLFEEMINSVIINFILNPNPNDGSLETDVFSLKSIINNFPDNFVSLRSFQLKNPCTTTEKPIDWDSYKGSKELHPPVCLLITSNKDNDTLIELSNQKITSLPIYKIEALSGSYSIPIFWPEDASNIFYKNLN